MLLPALVLALACPLSAWAVHLSPVSVAASSSTGSSLLAHELAYPTSLPEPIALDDLATLKLSLQVLDREGGKGVQPHQAGLSFVDVESGLDTVVPLNVRSNGKAKYALDTASLPLALRQTSGRLTVTLFVADFESSPIAYTLFTLSLPPSTLTHPPSSKALDEALFSTFNKQREIEWTFREDEPAVNPILSTVGLGAVLAPWVVLLALTGSIDVRKSLKPSSVPFLLSLAFLEGSILAYWFSYMKLFRFLAVFAVGGVVAIVTGRPAVRVLKQKKA